MKFEHLTKTNSEWVDLYRICTLRSQVNVIIDISLMKIEWFRVGEEIKFYCVTGENTHT